MTDRSKFKAIARGKIESYFGTTIWSDFNSFGFTNKMLDRPVSTSGDRASLFLVVK
jgi:hypothetical protein